MHLRKFCRKSFEAPLQFITKAADRKRMAREAMAKLIEGGW
jgi:hypothetical protein